MSLYSIGHSNHKIGRFLALLKAHEIKVVADVRTFPSSRKHPHFNQESLIRSLRAVGVEYVHLPDLGGRRRSVLTDSPNTGLTHPAFRSYADWMMEESFRQGVDHLLKLTGCYRVAAMCSEGWWVKCHRRLLSDYVQIVRQTPVYHISSRVRAEVHKPTDGVIQANSGLIYN